MKTASAIVVGHLVEDLSFRPLEPHEPRLVLVGHNRPPDLKQGGFFVFDKVKPGSYKLVMGGARYQTRERLLEVGEDHLYLEPPGENERLIRGNTERVGEATMLRFSPQEMVRRIGADQPVLADNLQARLGHSLGPGQVMQASLHVPNSFRTSRQKKWFRLVREWSFKLRFNPYHRFRYGITSMVGKIIGPVSPSFPQGQAQAGFPVELVALAGKPIEWVQVAGARFALTQEGKPLGSTTDLMTHTDDQGYFHLYFDKTLLPQTVTLAYGSPHLLRQEWMLVSGKRNFKGVDLPVQPRIRA